MSHAVEADLLVLVSREAEHFHAQKFKGAQEFSAALEQKLRIGPGELNQNLGTLPIAVVAHWRVHRDAVFHFESRMLHHGTEERVELICCLNFVHREAVSLQPSAFRKTGFFDLPATQATSPSSRSNAVRLRTDG